MDSKRIHKKPENVVPNPAAPGIARLEAVWLQENERVENTFHYRLSGAITVASLKAIADAYKTWLTTHTALFHAACQLVHLSVRDLSSSSGAVYEGIVSPPVNGTDAGGAQPNNVTFALKRETGLRGRHNRGRIYLIGLSVGRISTGSQALNAADAASFVTAYNALMALESSSAAATEVILHPKLGTGTDVLGYVFADLWLDSQRRRLPEHNRHR